MATKSFDIKDQGLAEQDPNAMQAMGRGGELRLGTGATPESIWVSVQDTGCGI